MIPLLALARRFAGLLVFALAVPPALADEALWRALGEGGLVLLIRHASTEAGTGDPPGFRLGDCRTQRNLSAGGREEAVRLGESLRARRVPLGEVRSSPWCRCLETAQLAFGQALPWPALSSLYRDSSQQAAQGRAVLDLAAKLPPGGNLVLVTHAYNIRALAGVSPQPAEIVVVRPEPDGFRLLGRLRGDAN